MLKPIPGTYALVLRSEQTSRVQIGRWGVLHIRPGFYLYVGSAFGPGGVRARVSRHCRRHKSKRWHIDFLREFARPLQVWCSYQPVHLEHRWASALAAMADTTPITGFGCSDCRCESHLFFTPKEPCPAAFADAVGSPVEIGGCERTG